MTAGFEGFPETVDEQGKRCLVLLKQEGLTEEETSDYAAEEGIFSQYCEFIHDFAFVLRADLPLDRVRDLVSAMLGPLTGARWLVDFGCGRVVAGVSGLRDEAWARLGRIAGKFEGHCLLEKAAEQFKVRHDVFGPARPEWKLAHRIKDALDPHNIFAPGRLPGRK